jgi:ribosome-associated heat shock protein Hsp15
MTDPASQRIDKWLWYARFAKTRAIAQSMARSGQIRVNRIRNGRASHAVKIGDVLTLATERDVRVVRIVEIVAASTAAPALPREPRVPAPDKRDRRLLRALKQSGG